MADYEISPMLRHSREDPRMIGAWKIGRTLGRGTSGVVKVARHSRTGKMAAVKMIQKSDLFSRRESLNMAGEDAEYQALSLQREIVIMKLIDHPHVLSLYDVWDASNELYLILEYVQGGELFEYMITKGRLSYSEALGYFQQIIAGVHYCHRFNIAHRDLKPENILLDSHMNIKIADFGMAVWQSGAMNHTSCGSPHYAAPEIVSGAAYDGAAADVWSCGVILYAMLAGKLPFDDDDTNNLLQKVCIGKFDMPPDIPNPVQDLLSRMLTKDTKKRITMAAIEQHPFFKSQKPKVIEHDMPSLDNIARPVSSRRDIDPELFKSLQTLWHGTDDEELIDSLMNKERNWQKGVYYLLDEYRKKSLEDYDEQEALAQDAKLHRRRTRAADRQRRLPGPDSYIPFSPSSIPPRDGPPTPRRARGRLSSSSSQESVYQPTQGPMLPSNSPNLFSPSIIQSPTLSIPGLPPLEIPDHHDDAVQAFFNQIADHLAVLHARTVSGSGTPNPTWVNDQADSLAALGISGSTKPLTVRRKPVERPTIDAAFVNDFSDKENISDGFEMISADAEVIPKSSLKQQGEKRVGKKVQIVEPPKRTRSKLRKRKTLSPVSPTSPTFTSTLSPSSPLPSSPVTWLASVFKFNPASYSLLSTHDLPTTRSECRRLLMEMNALVMLEDSEGLGVLKCRLEDIKDPTGSIGIHKSVKFRVEFHEVPRKEPGDRRMFSLLMVQEKGSLETFKEVYSRMKRDWA